MSFVSQSSPMSALPVELAAWIVQFIPDEELIPLALVSRFWWWVACQKCWRKATLDSLLRLMLGDCVLATVPFRRDAIIARLPSTFDPKQFTRFELYAGFVRELELGRRIVISSALYHQLVRPVEKLLLPNLRLVNIDGDGPRGFGWGSGLPRHAPDHGDLTMLFLSPSVRTLATRVYFTGLDPSALALRAPYLKDLHLWYWCPTQHQDWLEEGSELNMPLGEGVVLEPSWGTWPCNMVSAMVNWDALTSLMLNGAFMEAISLDSLGRVPHLRRLTIVEPGPGRTWDNTASATSLFPKLSELSLIGPFRALLPVLRCRVLTQKLERLTLLITSGAEQQDFKSAMRDLASNQKTLTYLKIQTSAYTAFRVDHEAAVQLKLLKLSELHLEIQGGIKYNDPDIWAFITGAGPQLTSLSVHNAPVSMLAKLLSRYPALSCLRVWLDAYDITTFDVPDAQVVTNQPLELELALLDNGRPLNEPNNDQWTWDRFGSYLLAICPHVSFRPKVKVPHLCEGQQEFLFGLENLIQENQGGRVRRLTRVGST